MPEAEPEREPVSPGVALIFTLVGFIALIIAGLGVVGLATNDDLIATEGLGQFPGLFGIVVAAGAFALVLWTALRRSPPSFWDALWVGLASFLGYLVGIAIGVLLAGAGPALAVGVAGRVATSLFGVVVLFAALVSAWSAIALVKTRAGRPRWPWEGDEEN